MASVSAQVLKVTSYKSSLDLLSLCLLCHFSSRHIPESYEHLSVSTTTFFGASQYHVLPGHCFSYYLPIIHCLLLIKMTVFKYWLKFHSGFLLYSSEWPSRLQTIFPCTLLEWPNFEGLSTIFLPCWASLGFFYFLEHGGMLGSYRRASGDPFHSAWNTFSWSSHGWFLLVIKFSN